MQNICDHKIETKEKNHCSVSQLTNCSNLGVDCIAYNSSYYSEINNTQNQDLLLISNENESHEDCKNNFPNLPIEPKVISLKKPGEKYFPHFKNKVVSFALKYSIKKAALNFKVNKGTISCWIHEFQQLNPTETHQNQIKNDLPGPDEQFIHWLKSFESNSKLSRQDVVDKVRSIIESYEKKEPSKINLWFFLYGKRLINNSCLDKIKIKYPLAFKKEVAGCTKYMSKKMISKIFNIDRKRICEWANNFNIDNVKERDVSKYLTDPNVDKMIWDWYCLQSRTPTSKEIRLKAAAMYQEAGYSGMSCSPGWYYRWRLRHQLPTMRRSQAYRDSKLLTWALIQIDKNKPIFHSDLLKQASLFQEPSFKASSSWVFRFIKKYKAQFKPGVTNLPLPDFLIEEVNNFRNLILSYVKKNNLQLQNIVAFDEIPLNFILSDSRKQTSIFGKSGWETCQASVIVSCLASGSLLPTALILKSSPELDANYSSDMQPIFVQSSGINDEKTIGKWLNIIMRFLKFPAMIIGDAYDPHIYIKNIHDKEFDKQNVNFLIIPGGCTSKLQPLFFGVTQKFKAEIETQWIRWCHEVSDSGNFRLKHPKSNNIVDWVQNAHVIINNTCKDLIKESFIKAGIVNNL